MNFLKTLSVAVLVSLSSVSFASSMFKDMDLSVAADFEDIQRLEANDRIFNALKHKENFSGVSYEDLTRIFSLTAEDSTLLKRLVDRGEKYEDYQKVNPGVYLLKSCGEDSKKKPMGDGFHIVKSDSACVFVTANSPRTACTFYPFRVCEQNNWGECKRN